MLCIQSSKLESERFDLRLLPQGIYAVAAKVKNKDGDTALHVAASHHMAEAVAYLLEKGADPDEMNAEARKPHSMAHGEAKELLLNWKKRGQDL